MTTKWGLFLCNCCQTLAIDPQKIDLPTPYVQLTSHPETDIHEFAALVKREGLERLLISCCTASESFNDILGAVDGASPKVDFVNLKDLCFGVHPDLEQAHDKAIRLLRAAMRSAEVQAEPAYNPLTAGGRILIAGDAPLGEQLAARLRDVAQPVGVVAADLVVSEPSVWARLYRGRVVDVKGRLGDFQVRIEEASAPEGPSREVQADQVVIFSHNDAPAVKSRTGCYLLNGSAATALDDLATRIRGLMGDFLKTVHVGYHDDICAGGAAGQEACGHCLTACPYDAIGRDAYNPLRIQVDHMTCEGCGACVSACPTSALRFTDPSSREFYTRLAALLEAQSGQQVVNRPVILFHCGEQGRRVLDEAGRLSLSYPASVLPVEVPCLRYVSEANMLAAFRLGAAGVGLLGCETCPHGEREVLHQKIDFCQLTLEAFGLGAERLQLITVAEGTEDVAIGHVSRLAETVPAAPIAWDGRPMRRMGNREVIADTIAAFIEQVGREPGRRALDAPNPFAIAEVRDDGCTMCRSCVNVCPVHAFRFEDETASLQFKHIDCVACGLCETVCPEHVITLHREIDFERTALDYQVVAQDEMIACMQCRKPYINRKALETIEAKLLSLASQLDAFTGPRQTLLRMCPDCRAVAAMLEVEKGWEP